MKLRFLLLLLAIAAATDAGAGLGGLRQKLRAIIGDNDVAVAVRCAGGDTLSISGDKACELASVAKFFNAAALAHALPYENLVADSVVVTAADLHKNTWSPMRAAIDRLPVSMPPAALLNYSLAMSDNNAADILSARYLAPAKADSILRSRFGLADFALAHTEAAMHANPALSPGNHATAKAATELIYSFFTCDTTAEATLVKALMGSDTPFGKERIPAGIESSSAKIFHKTGTGFSPGNGPTGAINDLALVSYPCPGGYSCYALGVFIRSFDGTKDEAERMIADISAAVWSAVIVDEVAVMNRNVNNIGIRQRKKIEPISNDEWKEALFDATMTAILEAVIGD